MGTSDNETGMDIVVQLKAFKEFEVVTKQKDRLN
jgi:hypothetical protein